ncbi:hypothetical protein CROQUDRAFT_644276 [Cronartium quercuum f. sp. fusiforme G11]|uniref:Uncharacterized protein n=1 Tax=Cronartium quercuum f. sp. fusiforme G11 TaxID=708437 RepID=A0A9P6NDR1_9BASI|nr:hypothetical protein CROQUDRAFT_644276 [Cronartium quercuum f. sp. fusiforme G11]
MPPKPKKYSGLSAFSKEIGRIRFLENQKIKAEASLERETLVLQEPTAAHGQCV